MAEIDGVAQPESPIIIDRLGAKWSVETYHSHMVGGILSIEAFRAYAVKNLGAIEVFKLGNVAYVSLRRRTTTDVAMTSAVKLLKQLKCEQVEVTEVGKAAAKTDLFSAVRLLHSLAKS